MAEVDEVVRIGRENEARKRQPLGVLVKKQEIDEGDAKAAKPKLNQLKDKLSGCKVIFTGIKSKATFLHILGTVDKENWPSKEEAENEFEDASVKLRGIKNEVSDSRGHIEEQVCEADEKYTSYQENMRHLEERLASLKEKKQKLEDMRKKHEEQLRILPNTNAGLIDVHAMLNIKLSNLKEMDKAVMLCTKSIEGINTTISQQRIEMKNLRNRGEEGRSRLCVAQSFAEQRNQANTLKLQWCENVGELLQNLTGIKEHTVVEDSHVVVEIVNPVGTPDHPDLKLLLEIQFKKCKRFGLQLQDAKANIGTFNVSDVVAHAVDTNSVQYLVNEVNLRWQHHLISLAEIVALRDRFAIDWIPEENTLRQMVGNGAKNVCSLRIPSEPPLNKIELISIEGNSEDVDIRYLQPPGENPNLKDWLEYLECRFGGN